MIIQFRALRSTALLTGLVLAVGGCLGSESLKKKSADASLTSGATSAQVLNYGAGTRSAKIVFRITDANSSQNYGSFDSAQATNPTPNEFGEGVPVARYYGIDDTLIGPTVPFIRSAEVRISGPGNTAAQRPGCARFTPFDATGYQCGPTAPATPSTCSGPAGYYAVNEAECSATSTTTARGSGAPTDGVGVFIELDRSAMGSFENLKITLQYNAAAPVTAGSGLDPALCFAGPNQNVDPTNPNCSPLSWQAYLRSSLDPSESPHAFLNLFPPVSQVVENDRIRSAVQTRDIIVPLAAYPEAKYLFLTRTDANAGLAAQCMVLNQTVPLPYGNLSALCHGVVLMSAILERF